MATRDSHVQFAGVIFEVDFFTDRDKYMKTLAMGYKYVVLPSKESANKHRSSYYPSILPW